MMVRHPFYARKRTEKMQLLFRIAFFQCVFLCIIPLVIILHPFPINFYHTSVYVLQRCSVAVPK